MSMKEIRELLQELRDSLEIQKELGVDRIPSTREIAEPSDEINIKSETVTDSQLTQKKDQKKEPAYQPDLAESGEKETLEEIRHDLGECTRCKLHEGRTNIVFGEGNPQARIVFVGEGPGRDEDQQGRPFVGRAGKLLTRIINAMGLKRSDVYICNVVKCRPPNNRNPEPDEVAACEPFLLRQIRSIQPEVIICLGSVATSLLLKTKNVRMGNLRGQFHQYGNSKLMITYHPAALLRNPNFKKPVWEDMKIVMKELGLPLPKGD